MNGSKKQCQRKHIHGSHGWFLGRDWYTCPGVDAESEVMKWWTGDKSYTVQEHAWPTFEVRVGSSGALLLWCVNCGWSKHFASGQPVLWSVLATKVSRHGMTHAQGEQA